LTLIVWSSSYAAIAYGLQGFTPSELILSRFLLASLCFAVPVALRLVRLPPRQDWPAVIALGLIGNVGYQLCLCYSMTRISPGAAAVVISLVPGVTSVLALLRLHEALSKRAIVGLLIAFAGTLLVTVGGGDEIRFEPIAFLVFVAVLCSSSYFVWQKPLLTRTSPLGFTAASMFVATIAMLPFGIHLPEKILTVPPALLLDVLYLALVPTVIGFLSWSFALSRAPASRVSSFLYLQPVGACVIAWLWLDQIPTWITVIGGALAIGGVVLTTLHGNRLKLPRGWGAPAKVGRETGDIQI
ncbi:MAG: DMT family transporter, partial [Gammaproteobacteria bacterium]